MYDLHFAVGGVDAYRVVTTRQSVALPDTTWQSFVGKNVEVMLYGAQLLRNEVAQGPFRAATLSIVVMP